MEKDGVFAVHSVYYDDDGKIQGWSENSLSPEVEDLDELKTTLELMLESLKEDIIKVDSITEKNER